MKARPEVTEHIPRNKNHKKYSFLPLGESVTVFSVGLLRFAAINLCITSQPMFIIVLVKHGPQLFNG